MKFIGLLIFQTFIFSITLAQNPLLIKWQKCFGGTFLERGYSITKADNDNYVIAGFAESDDGDVSGNHNINAADFWVVKITGSGDIIWQKCLGGYSAEIAFSIQNTADNGFIVAGSANSNDGDISGNHGGIDAWVVKLNNSGNIEWQKCLGGSLEEAAWSIIQTSDGGYAVAGYSRSNDGDVTGNHGQRDFWVVRLDGSGSILWQKSLGGNSYDEAKDIIETLDGGFVVVGETYSFNNGDVTGSNGEYDCWVVKLDSLGNLEWQKSLGGNLQDRGYCVSQLGNGDLMVGAYLNSYGLNLCSGAGDSDFWMVQLNSAGNIVNQHCHGGERSEYVNDIIRTADGGFALIGSTTSLDQEVPDSHGEWIEDYWLITTDSLGNLLKKKSLGGSSVDIGTGIVQAANNDFIISGYTFSNDGDISGSKGQSEFWVLRVAEDYNLITGTCYVDANGNFVNDPGELPVQNFHTTEYNTNNSSFTRSNGEYTIAVFDSGNYMSAPAPLMYYNFVPGTQSSTFSGINQIDSLNDFAFQPSGVFNDLCVTITPTTPFRPGFNAAYIIKYYNQGTTTINPTVIFYPDSQLTYISSSQTPFSVSSDSIAWAFGPLAPFQSGTIEVIVNINIGTPINSLINSTAVIEPIAGDAFPSCNDYSWEVFVTGSFDPNDILVNRDTIYDFELSSPPYLEYIIRFQNTGNDTAFNVRVENNIPVELDLNSFEISGSSHSLNMSFDAHSRLMKFSFNNILLPDSGSNQIASNGFVRYRIKPLSFLSVGQNILNNAAIYFDYNEAILTNTVVTKIDVPTGLNNETNEKVMWNVFPNPANSDIFINYNLNKKSFVSIDIDNLFGQKVKTLKTEETNAGEYHHKFNVESLSNGVYLIQFLAGDSRQVRKFVKVD